MAVYVDTPLFAFKGMKMCHMVADTPAELDQMADKLKLNRSWKRYNKLPHYDLSRSKREQAIAFVALPVDHGFMSKMIRAAREKKEKGQ